MFSNGPAVSSGDSTWAKLRASWRSTSRAAAQPLSPAARSNGCPSSVTRWPASLRRLLHPSVGLGRCLPGDLRKLCIHRIRLSGQFDGLAMGRVPIRLGPGLLAAFQRRSIGQTFGRHQVLKCSEPVLIVMRAVVRLAAVGCSLEFVAKRAGPFAPRKMPLLGKLGRRNQAGSR